ncbi:MAG: hypothetical protein QF466_02905 [Desulfobacterales bacterium]|jgi:hypothetical protein|nr:hypothetical protein [Desulfobacterales bacterium]MDP6684005.1 hypothetical protein [Desulfobacterales bacterium]MDP6806214.1 hypothetical protein [Desulfobacterales bacterium]|tara:strand:+ start:6641 stop:6901 length:261 start_codon:yes stop_codon:yes gene_type:complete
MAKQQKRESKFADNSHKSEDLKKKAHSFLKAARNSTLKVHDSVDLGQNIHLQSKKVAGSSLVYKEQVLHMALFAKKTDGKGNRYTS